MAEGGTRQGSFNDDIDELFCDRCRSENKQAVMEAFCQICEEHLCDYCLNVHRIQSPARSHVILYKTHLVREQETDICEDTCVKQENTRYELNSSNESESFVPDKPPLEKTPRMSVQKTKNIKETEENVSVGERIADIVATFRGNLDVKMDTDTNCSITDCILLGPDKMVVTDGGNQRIKLIDINKNIIISSFSTSCKPSKVTAISTDQIAVVLQDERKIQIFEVTAIFTNYSEIQVKDLCNGIAYKDGKFAVSYINQRSPIVEIIDTQGHMLHKILPSQMSYYIRFGHENETVIVSNFYETSVITFRGEVLREYYHDSLMYYTCCMEITKGGELFACNWFLSTVFLVSRDFKTCRTIIDDYDNVVNPTSITYCDKNHRLYISSQGDMMNTIKIYDLNL